MSPPLSYCSWLKVGQASAFGIIFHGATGFGGMSDDSEVAFWTGILGQKFLLFSDQLQTLLSI